MNDIQILPDGVLQAPTNQNKAEGSTGQSERTLICMHVACQFLVWFSNYGNKQPGSNDPCFRKSP